MSRRVEMCQPNPHPRLPANGGPPVRFRSIPAVCIVTDARHIGCSWTQSRPHCSSRWKGCPGELPIPQSSGGRLVPCPAATVCINYAQSAPHSPPQRHTSPIAAVFDNLKIGVDAGGEAVIDHAGRSLHPECAIPAQLTAWNQQLLESGNEFSISSAPPTAKFVVGVMKLFSMNDSHSVLVQAIHPDS